MFKKLALLLLLAAPVLKAQTAALPVYDCTQHGTQALTSGLKSTNFQQGIVPSCQVTIYLTGTTTIATTSPQSPFTANSNGSLPPVYAATGQGYDVVFSGKIPPNTYPSPVTLTDVTIGGGGGGGSPGSPNGSAQFNNASALGGEPAYLYASAFSGSDWVAKVNACGTALATNGGGACDATDLAGQTSTSTLTWGDGVHIMDLKLGQGTYTAKSYVYRTFSQWHAPGNAGSTAPPGTTLVCSQPTANVFTGSVSGSTLTVTAVSTGALALYQTVIGPGLDQYALIVALGTGTGGTGTYTLANAYTVSSTTLNTGNACMSGYPETGFGNQLHNPVMQGFQIESSGSAAQGNGSTGLLLGDTARSMFLMDSFLIFS